MSQISQFRVAGAGGASINTLTGDLGTPAVADGAGNVDIIGGTNINSSSDAAGHQVTINLDGTISLTRVNATTFDTNVVSAALEITGTTISADGTDADININITAKGAGTVVIDELTLTTDLAVTEGGTGVSTLTDHGVLVGSGTGAITPLAVGATGEMLIGNTGADASWSATGALTTLNATTVNATTFDTNVVAAGVTLSGTTLSADGTDANININITAKGTGQVIIDDLQLTTDLAVTEGGTGVSTLTDHGVLFGSGASAITSSAALTDGQLVIGHTGANADIAALTEGTNIDVTNASGSITLETTKVEINAQTGTTYQFVAGDAGKLVTLTNAAAITLTVPANATVAFPTGTVITIYQGGAGTVTVTPAGGVTINSIGAKVALSAQYAMAALHKIGSDLWILAGSLA